MTVVTSESLNFDTLVPGDENVLALSAAHKIAAEPGTRYNPLFLFGPPGTGKSHLLAALRQRLEAVHPSWNLLFLPAGEFIDECEQAWQDDRTVEFRRHLWSMDAVLLDDVQSVGRSAAARTELRHLLDRMIESDRQVVLASRLPPAEIEGFDATLRSRLGKGLVTAMEPPKERLLRDILDRRCSQLGLRLSPQACNMLAREVRSIRELDGLLHSLETTESLRLGGERVVTLAEVRGLLEANHVRSAPSVEDVARAVCGYLQVDLQRIRSASRQQPLVQARQLAMYLARELTGLPLTEIGKFFGGRDHTTVLYACRKIGEQMHEGSYTSRASRDIRAKLEGI